MSKKVYDSFEDELDDIRLSLYEEVKGMTPEEEVAHIHDKTEPIMRKFGIERSTLKPVRPMKRERVAVI